MVTEIGNKVNDGGKNLLKERLKAEIGRPYTDIEAGFTISKDGSKITYLVPSDFATSRKIGEILSIYDLISETWFGSQIIKIDRRSPFELNKDRNLYGIDDSKIVERFENREGIYDNPSIITVELRAMY